MRLTLQEIQVGRCQLNPGRILLMVIQGSNSLDNDFAHEAIAPLRVFESPILSIGSRTEVEMIFTNLP